jgi:large subunit ribosomal protein L15
MQLHDLKLNFPRKKRKTVGRGGKKGTYSGRGNKGQKARSGAHVDPLFEGGRSTLIDHMKKKKGFISVHIKRNIVALEKIEKKFKDGDTMEIDSLIKMGLVDKMKRDRGVKILGGGIITKKFLIGKNIFLSKKSKASIAAAGSKIIDKK